MGGDCTFQFKFRQWKLGYVITFSHIGVLCIILGMKKFLQIQIQQIWELFIQVVIQLSKPCCQLDFVQQYGITFLIVMKHLIIGNQ